jgi:alpha-L-fucosidase
MRRGPRRGIVGVMATTAVVAGTAGAVSHHQQQKYANQAAEQQAQAQSYDNQAQMDQMQQQMAQMQAQQAQAAAPAPAAAPADPAGMDQTTAQLQNLANLHAQGILSDEEFAAAKAKALGLA